MTDVSERLSEIRERVEAATEGPWRYRRNRKGYGTGLKTEYWFLSDEAENTTYPGNPAPVFTVSSVHGQSDWEPIDPEDAEFVASARSDVPYLLSLVEEIGEALASLSATEIDGLLGAVEYQNPENSDRLVKALAQVRDAALKAEYEGEVKVGE